MAEEVKKNTVNIKITDGNGWFFEGKRYIENMIANNVPMDVYENMKQSVKCEIVK